MSITSNNSGGEIRNKCSGCSKRKDGFIAVLLQPHSAETINHAFDYKTITHRGSYTSDHFI